MKLDGSRIEPKPVIAQQRESGLYPAPPVLIRGHHYGHVVGQVPGRIAPYLRIVRLGERKRAGELGELDVAAFLLKPVCAKPYYLGEHRAKSAKRGEHALLHSGRLHWTVQCERDLSGDGHSGENGDGDDAFHCDTLLAIARRNVSGSEYAMPESTGRPNARRVTFAPLPRRSSAM